MRCGRIPCVLTLCDRQSNISIPSVKEIYDQKEENNYDTTQQ